MPQPINRQAISLDTECGGLDRHHIARPFLVTICRQDGTQPWWQWPVDPHTRMPEVSQVDIGQIREELAKAGRVYLHGAKFDGGMLRTVGIELPWD